MGTEQDEAAGDRYTTGVFVVLRAAEIAARWSRARFVGTDHLLTGLLAPETTAGAVLRLVTEGTGHAAPVLATAPVVVDLTDADDDALELSPRAVRVMRAADELAGRLGHRFVGSGHVLLALAKDEGSPGGERLAQLGIEYERLLGEVAVAYAHARRPAPPALDLREAEVPNPGSPA